MTTPKARTPTVQDYVGTRFESYARVFFPAAAPDGSVARWSDVARASGTTVTSESRWEELAAARDEDLDEPPWSPDSVTAGRLSDALRPFTASTEFHFLVWEGYGSSPFERDGAPTVVMPPDRVMFLLTGEQMDTVRPTHADDVRLPLRWWPAGREWCVGNDIYARSLFVGGSQAAIDAVLAHPGLEALPISPYAGVPEE